MILTRPRPQHNAPFQHSEGVIFGTTFHATYQADSSLTAHIFETLHAVDRSLSMFNPQSTISHINKGLSTHTDSLFRTVFRLSTQVSQATDGAFDITVAPLVNAWGFGFKHHALPDSTQVDSLRALVGWQRVHLQGEQLLRDDPRMVIDMSAVAKGFGADQVGRMFQQMGVKNYMIEIGGEIVASGANKQGRPWRIGINKPQTDTAMVQNELQTILNLTDCAMATSGNYRNYYLHEGRKIAHTIDPKSGYPVQRSILSSTVLAPTCAMADAYATAFMVLGMERALQVLDSHPELKAYFIYTTDNDSCAVWKSAALDSLIIAQ